LTAPNNEIVIFADRAGAIQAGFTAAGLHPKLRGTTAWWPDKGTAGISMTRWKRVTISHAARTTICTIEMARAMDEGLHELRKGGAVFGDAFVWMEL